MKTIIFCGCGGLYNYSLGIAKIIQKIIYENKLDSNYIKLVGISAGSYPALLLSLNLDIDNMFTSFNKELLQKISSFYLGSLFSWYKYVKTYTLKYLPENSYETSNLFLYTTDIFNRTKLEHKNWDSNNDLVDCIIASTYIPLFGGGLYFKYKNNYCIDGAMSYDYHGRKDTEDVLYIYPDKWRTTEYNWYYCYSNYKWAEKQYKYGEEDANKNKEYILDFLKNN
jgi:hypothetical protein